MFKISARLLRKIDSKHTRLNYEFFMIWFWLFFLLFPPHLYEIDIVCTSDYVFHWAWLFVMNIIWIFLLHLKNLCSPYAVLFFSFRHHAVKFFIFFSVRCIDCTKKSKLWTHRTHTLKYSNVKLKSRNAFRHVKWWKYFSNFWHKTKILLLKYFPIYIFSTGVFSTLRRRSPIKTQPHSSYDVSVRCF